MSDELTIVRRETFQLRRGDKTVGRLEFRRDGDTIIFTHTEVDESMRGHGCARRLLDHATEWVRDQELVAARKAECPYVRKQFKEDDSFEDILVD